MLSTSGIPTTAYSIVKMRPAAVDGYKCPYPIVVQIVCNL